MFRCCCKVQCEGHLHRLFNASAFDGSDMRESSQFSSYAPCMCALKFQALPTNIQQLFQGPASTCGDFGEVPASSTSSKLSSSKTTRLSWKIWEICTTNAQQLPLTPWSRPKQNPSRLQQAPILPVHQV